MAPIWQPISLPCSSQFVLLCPLELRSACFLPHHVMNILADFLNFGGFAFE